jgi:hypothetical protein
MNNYQNHPLAGATDLDSAFNKLWYFYKKYFIGLYIISVVSALLTSLFTKNIDLASFQTVSSDPEAAFELMKSWAGPYTLMMLVSLLFVVVLHIWVLERPAGEQGSMPSMLKMTLVALLPYLVAMVILTVIMTLLITGGVVLLVLPGLFALFYMATVIMFAMPVTLVETRNPFEVIGRSFRLAHKNLWPNMGWVVVVLLIIVIASMLLSALVMLPFTGTFMRSFADPEQAASLLEMHRNPLFIGLNALTTALVTPLMPILAFLLYFRNRSEEAVAEITTDNDGTVRVEDLYPPVADNN